MSNKKYYVFVLSFLLFITLVSGVCGLEENKIKQAHNLVSLEEMNIKERIEFLNQKINEKNLSWVAGETSMSKLSKEERRARLGLIKPPFQKQNAGIETNYVTSPLSASYPSSLDWRNKDGNDWISPIKDQGECGACWAFSSVAVVEARTKIELNNPSYNIDLSEQDVISCSTGDGSCSDGLESDALAHMKNTGIVKESCFAYTATNNSCLNKCSNWQNEILKVQNYNLISASAGSIKQAVNDYGSVTVYMAVYEDFNDYSVGVYSWAYGDYLGLHSISIVGYNDAGQYWICKNSWGTGWGESGYFKIAYSENVLDFNTWDPEQTGEFFLDESYYVTGIDFVTEPLPNLVFAITPNSRLAQVGTPVTIFMSVINAGTGSATDVSISQASSLPATISYQAWNGVTLTGTPDTPMDIGSGETVNYVLTINPTSEFVSSAMTFDVSGTNSGSAPISGVNTLTMAASTTPYADVIMMSTSLDVSTAVNTPTAFALATMNVGSASATDVSLIVEVPTSITGLAYQVNETNLDGSIKGPATGLTIPVGGSPTFAVFLTPTQAIDYDPANNRIVLKLVDGSGKVVGAQSVAVSTT